MNLPTPLKFGSFGFTQGRVALMQKLIDANVPSELLSRIRLLPEDKWTAPFCDVCPDRAVIQGAKT